MDLRQLRIFLHVAELGSFSAAADSLNTAQPAISRVVQGLEAELAVRLFARHGRGVRLTEAGEKLVARAGRILRELEEARDELAGGPDDPAGQVALALPPTVATVLSGPLIARYTAAYPRVQLRILAGSSGYVREWLIDGSVDFAVTYQNRHLRSLSAQPLLTERLWAAAAPGALQPDRPIAFRELAARPLILAAPEHALRILLDQTAEQLGLQLAPVVETDNLQVQLELAARGVGATVVPIVAAERELAAGQLSAAPIADPELSRRLYLVTSRRRAATPAAARLRAMLAEEVAALVRAGRWDAVPA